MIYDDLQYLGAQVRNVKTPFVNSVFVSGESIL